MADRDIPEEMVEKAAVELRDQYDSEHDAAHLSWQDFVGEARAVLSAALAGRTVVDAGEKGRCGNQAPKMLAGGPQTYCQLPSGHAGWHRGDDHSEWTEQAGKSGGREALAGHDPHALNVVAGTLTDLYGFLPLDVRYGAAAAALLRVNDWHRAAGSGVGDQP